MTEMKDGVPTGAAITELMPYNRRAYAIVRQYLGLPFKERVEVARKSIEQLVEADDAGKLEPPLSLEMAQALIAYNSLDDEKLKDQHLLVDFLLEAVFEHGYGNGI